MKKAQVFCFLVTMIFFLFTKAYSQDIEFESHTITENADGARSVYAIDVDSDGDIDVLSASDEDDKIAWYENDGDENFTDHTITTSADGAIS
ncbi:MAG: VCBS repeat-containing protein, partial [Bacteroidales bacterium]|nr:VCBS repeat-containing protein [Bacteroidales bacterium]